MKIGVFCYHDEPYKCVADVTMPVLAKYCARHGYDLHVSNKHPIDRDILWQLVPDLVGGFEQYDWCVHLNTDVLITNHNLKIERLLDRHLVIPIVLDSDLRWTLNDGFLAVKNSALGLDLLNRVWNMMGERTSLATNGRVTCPLNAIEVLHRTNWNTHSLMHIVDQNSCNSFLYTEYGMPDTTVGNWRQGDFLLHLPGRTNARRVELFTEWLPKIEW